MWADVGLAVMVDRDVAAGVDLDPGRLQARDRRCSESIRRPAGRGSPAPPGRRHRDGHHAVARFDSYGPGSLEQTHPPP